MSPQACHSAPGGVPLRRASGLAARFWRCREGSSAIENALLAALIALVAILATEFLARDVFSALNQATGAGGGKGLFSGP